MDAEKTNGAEVAQPASAGSLLQGTYKLVQSLPRLDDQLTLLLAHRRKVLRQSRELRDEFNNEFEKLMRGAEEPPVKILQQIARTASGQSPSTPTVTGSFQKMNELMQSLQRDEEQINGLLAQRRWNIQQLKEARELISNELDRLIRGNEDLPSKLLKDVREDAPVPERQPAVPAQGILAQGVLAVTRDSVPVEA